MPKLATKDVLYYVEANIGTFHEKRLQSLDRLNLTDILKRKNPYLYRAKSVATAEQIVKRLVDAHLSSNEETIFGDWLEGLAIYVNKCAYGGYKSGIQGVDLEFDKDEVRFIVAIKSGPSWANGSQIAKMKADFTTAKKILRTSGSGLQIIAVNGCCYGRDNKPDKGEYFKYCGQKFWEFISGDKNLYLDIVESIGHEARAKNDAFMVMYSNLINKISRDFANLYCSASGEINWNLIVELNASEKPKSR
jgi:hypothetical protein